MDERGPSGDSVASLAATVLDEEAARQAAQEKAREQVIFPDDLLPGVNAEQLSLREGLRAGGWLMFIVLTCIVSLDELEGAAVYVLAPEIRRTFGISEGTIVFIGTASAAFFVLGAVPMGWLADRVKRVPIVGISAMFFGRSCWHPGSRSTRSCCSGPGSPPASPRRARSPCTTRSSPTRTRSTFAPGCRRPCRAART